MSPNSLSNSNSGAKPSLLWRIGSAVVVGTAGAVSRAFLYGFNDVHVIGLPGFLEVLDKRKDVNQRKRGLITVCNHISIVDDPSVWGILPLRYSLDQYNHRWSLGAHDICFPNKFFSTFFSLGQVLPTRRKHYSSHGGIFQPTMTQSIRLLSAQPFASPHLSQPDSVSHETHFSTDGKDRFHAPSQDPDRRHSWIHIFPEGSVHQRHSLGMRYFRWGVARMILEAEPGPELVPMFIDGMHKIMPEDRKFPKFLPRIGNKVTVAIGPSIDTEAAFGDLRGKWKELVSKHRGGDAEASGRIPVLGDPHGLPDDLKYGPEAVALRKEATKRVRDEVSKLRRRLGYPDEDPSCALADTWAGEEHNNPKYTSDVDGSMVKKR